jgi:hypothetical protein
MNTPHGMDTCATVFIMITTTPGSRENTEPISATAILTTIVSNVKTTGANIITKKSTAAQVILRRSFLLSFRILYL